MSVDLIRCSRKNGSWHCANFFCADRAGTSTRCDRCRSTAQSAKKTTAGKARQQRWNGSNNGKAAVKKYRKGDNGKSMRRRYRSKLPYKESQKRRRSTPEQKMARRKYDQSEHRVQARVVANRSEAGKARTQKRNREVQGRLSRSLYMMIKDLHPSPSSIPRVGGFETCEEARQHMKSMFEDWMTFENAGRYCRGMEYNTRWQNGHHLPKSIYNPKDAGDLRKCWSPENLFPQCARLNHEQRDRKPSSEILESKRHLWPSWWNNRIPAVWMTFRVFSEGSD